MAIAIRIEIASQPFPKKSHLHIASTLTKNRICYHISKLNKNNLRFLDFFINYLTVLYLVTSCDYFVIIMYPGKGKKFGYDLLCHSAYCIEHDIVIEASKKFKSSKKY